MRKSTWVVSIVSALVVVLLAPTTAVGAPNLTSICHLVDDEPGEPFWTPLAVAEMSVPGHRNHGDGLPGDVVPGSGGAFVFDDECVAQLVEVIFAVAYTDVDPTDGPYNRAVDSLIAKLIDGPGAAADGYLGEGDVVVTERYPTDFAATAFGEFSTTTHVVGPQVVNAELCAVRNSTGSFLWRDEPLAEFYREYLNSDITTRVDLVDGFVSNVLDLLDADVAAPSHPSMALLVTRSDAADATFVDVDNDCLENLPPTTAP